MKPIVFKEHTRVLSKPQAMTDEQCASLAVFDAGDGQLLSCWRASWRERVSVLLFGKVWLWVWSGKTQPPVSLEARRTVFEEREWTMSACGPAGRLFEPRSRWKRLRRWWWRRRELDRLKGEIARIK